MLRCISTSFILLLTLTELASSDGLSPERLRDARREPQNWLTYSGQYSGWRHTELKQIHRDNVRRLAAQWIFQFKGIAHKFEATPLVVDGIMYFPALDNRVF